jgi:acyl carrier protein
MNRDEIPPHRITTPSSRIDWAALPVAIPERAQRWPRRGRPGRAGVSAFGFTGSNAHVLVEQAPAVTPAPLRPPAGASFVLPVTAASQTALRAAAARMASRLRRGPAEVADIAFTAVYQCSWLDHRAVVAGDSAASLAEALEAVAAGDPHPRARLGVSESEQPVEATAWYGDERSALAAAALLAAGGEPAGPAVPRPPVSLPSYPWDRRRYWLSAGSTAPLAAGAEGTARTAQDAEGPGRTFTVTWQPVQPPAPALVVRGSWIVIGAGRWADDVARSIGEQGHRIVRATAEQDPGDWAATLTRLASDLPDCRGVLLVAAAGGGAPGAAGSSPDVPAALALGQAMASMPRALGRLWFLTRGAHDPVAGTSVRPAHAALWELGRVLAMELPGRWGGLLDVYGEAASVSAALHAADLDDQVCVRDGQWYAARLTEPGRGMPGDAGPGDGGPVRADAELWHVVIGGDAAGVAVHALARRGARKLLLAGDVTGPGDDSGIRVERCGLDDLDDRLADLGPLGEVIAVAAPLPTTTLATTTQAVAAGALADAVRLASLCEIAALREPRSITLVTSAAPSWGSVGTAPGAAATGWLAGWARTARAVPARVVALMPRAGTGELSEAHRGLFEESGLRLLTAQDSADALARAMTCGPAERHVADVDLSRYVRLCQELAPRGFLTALEVADAGAPLYDELIALSPDKRLSRLTEHAAAVVADVLGAEPGSLDPVAGFFDLGMDSVMALRVRVRLEKDLAVELPATLTFEYPTAAALAAHLASLVPAAGPQDEEGMPEEWADATDDDLMRALDAAMAAAEQDLAQGKTIQ